MLALSFRYLYSWFFIPLLSGFCYGIGYLISKSWFKKHIIERYYFPEQPKKRAKLQNLI